MRLSVMVVAIDLAVVACARPISAGEWPTFQGNAAHSGYLPLALDPAGFSPLWQVTVGKGGPLSPPAIGAGRVFVSEGVYFGESEVHARETRDGSPAWSFPILDVFSLNPPAHADGRVYVQSGNHGSDTWLWSFDAASGAVNFQSPFSAQWERYEAPTVFEGSVYINGGYYGGMYAFDAIQGSFLWFHDLPQVDGWTPAVDSMFAYALLAPGVHVIDRFTGALFAQISDPNFASWSSARAPVLDGRGSLYGVNGRRLLRFDLLLRRLAWEQPGDFQLQPTIARGKLYAIDGKRLGAWDPALPTLLWSWAPSAGTLRGTILVTDTHALVGTETHTYAVNLETQSEDWSVNAEGALAVADGALYIAGTDGRLTAIQLSFQQACLPAELPGALARLELVRAGAADVALSWEPAALALGGYHGYRFLNKADAPIANQSGELVFATQADAAAAAGVDPGAVGRPPPFTMYQVVGVCARGTEGAL